ncbi:MAG: GNAT family N-acetyltransferase, partial [Actinomycetota bacterium]|nr:GNAT family N-acetyltransferase [Actinomycetota bacterium]
MENEALQVRTIEPDEFRTWVETCEATFGAGLPDGDLAAWAKVFPLDRCVGAYDGDAMVATAGAFNFSLSVPGGECPAAGVTAVGVLPSHRRKGLLAKMMK